MKTKVFGKKIVNFYEIKPNQKFIQDENGCDKQVFTAKPTITKVQNLDEWVELHSFDGEPRYNRKGNVAWGAYDEINLSENECVKIEEEIFRADLNELHLHTDKIVEENDYEKECAELGYKTLIGEFNTQMIESNDKLKSYCEIHNLKPEETDCIKLFTIVFPNCQYEIIDGVIEKKSYIDAYPINDYAYIKTATNNIATNATQITVGSF